jgi:hypothetical protein
LESEHLNFEKDAEDVLLELDVPGGRLEKMLNISTKTDDSLSDVPWTTEANTIRLPTNAYGNIEFLGAPHSTKAQVSQVFTSVCNQ